MINYWLAIDESLYADIASYAQNPTEYDGDAPEQHIEMFLDGVVDFVAVSEMFKKVGNKNLCSVYVTNSDIFDFLITEYPTTEVIGSWNMYGKLLSELADNILSYMPDVWEYNSDDSGQYVPATELTGVNAIAGQKDRSFS